MRFCLFANQNQKYMAFARIAADLNDWRLSRVEELADRPDGYRPDGAPNFEKLVELDK